MLLNQKWNTKKKKKKNLKIDYEFIIILYKEYL
jgi:hypothetical protein